MPTIAPTGADISLARELCAMESMYARRSPGELPALDRAEREALQIATRLRESTPDEALTVARMLAVVSTCLDQFAAVSGCSVTEFGEVLARAAMAHAADRGLCPSTVLKALSSVVQARRTLSYLAAIPD